MVIGGASGIGRATATRFASAGAGVTVVDVDARGAETCASEIIAAGGNAISVTADVARYEEVAGALDAARQRFGSLDVAFNCAAIAVHRPLLEHEPEDFERVVRVNQLGTFNGMLAAARVMRDLRTPGCIINTASVLAYVASSGSIGYHASKGAVRSMTHAAAIELAPLGIRVVAVAPGAVDTQLLEPVRTAGLERELARRHMRRRVILPERVADVVVFLASREADAINGTVVMVDDGYTAFK